ncbi:hypothetical protein BC943DRAFT_360284 [Umbelopsis sp. AD052]|nr:hypothetical protein BC943DRAFT_360284 [Umbelopsis sp. AD052]
MGDDSDGPSQPNQSFSPEYIMEFQWKRKARFYKIKWKDAAEPDFTWEDAEDIEPLYPSLVENFWAQIDTRRGLSPNSSASEPSVAPSTDDSSSEYDSAKDEDFKAPTDSPSEDESFSADWKTVRSVEGMDKTLDGHVRVYIRWYDGRKTIHPLSVIKRKCAEQLLAFYERHLQIQGITLPE